MAFYTLLENLGVRDFLSLVSVVITIYVARYYYKYFTRVNPLPGPFPFPLVGNLPQLTYFKGSIKEFFEDCHRKYGDLFEIELGVRRIVFSRVEYIEKILVPSTKSQYMLRFPYTKGLEEIGMLGRGLLANNNLKSWRYNRQFFTQAILSPKFTREAIDWTNRLFNELEEYWDKLYLKEGARNELDFSAWINRYTNDMVIALLTGERSYTMAVHFNTKSDEKSVHPPAIVDDSERFVQAFRKQVLGLSMFLFVPPFVRHYVPVFKQISDDLVRNVKFIYERLEIIIKRRRQEIEGSPLDQPLPHDMLTSLITASTPRDINYTKTVEGEAMRPMTDIEIRGVIHDGFLAGTDTTANMVTFIVYYLARHPDVKKKMLEEIDGIFQGDKTRPITEGDFHNLKYCEAIAKEVNRVLPVFNTMLRHSEEPGEIAGYEWPAGTTFHVNAPIVHKHKDYWDEPERFNPDRWMVKGFEPKKHSFVMFGGGLRMCPGRKLAMIEMTCLMALLFRRYEIDLVDTESPLKIRSTVITTCPELFVKIRPRN